MARCVTGLPAGGSSRQPDKPRRAGSLPLLGARVLLAGEGGGKLGAGVDAQLAEGVGEVGLDGLLGDEQALGDLPVGLPGAGQAGDAQFAGSEGVAAAGGGPPGPGAGGEQFGQCAVLQGAGAALMSQRQAFFQRRPCGGAVIGAAFGGAQFDQRQRQFQLSGGVAGQRDRLVQQRCPARAADGQPLHAQRAGQRPVGSPAASQGGVLVGNDAR